MVVEAEDTVVARIAMGGPWRPEDLAGLTKFHLVHCRTKRIERPIKDPLIFILSEIIRGYDLTSALLYLAGSPEPQTRPGIIPGSIMNVTKNSISVRPSTDKININMISEVFNYIG